MVFRSLPQMQILAIMDELHTPLHQAVKMVCSKSTLMVMSLCMVLWTSNRRVNTRWSSRQRITVDQIVVPALSSWLYMSQMLMKHRSWVVAPTVFIRYQKVWLVLCTFCRASLVLSPFLSCIVINFWIIINCYNLFLLLRGVVFQMFSSNP